MPSVLITGASRGLGLELARQYAAEGWRVYAACRNPQGATQLASLSGRSRPSGGAIAMLHLDVTDPRSIEQAAGAVTEPVDVLIHSAGIMGASQTFGRMDYGAWEEVLRVNTLGPLRVSEAFAEHVARSARKLIVTLSSGLGSIADNTSGGWIAYRSSKAAVNMVTRSLAVELAPRGIACVAVSPGWVQTDMGGPGAPLTPAESVAGMRRLIGGLRPDGSGRFFSYDGREMPW